MKYNTSIVNNIFILCLLSISVVSVGGESQGRGSLMDALGTIGCGANQGKRIHFKTKYTNKKISSSSNLLFCAESNSDCIKTLNDHLEKNKVHTIKNEINIYLSSSEIESVSVVFCKKEFPSSVGNNEVLTLIDQLINAALNGNYLKASKLIKNKADINETGTNGTSPLVAASGKGHTDIVKLLLTAKADVNKAATKGITPLFMASHENHPDVVKLLLAAKADVNPAGLDTPLSAASGQGNADVVKLLLAENADVNKSDSNGITPLIMASASGHADVVKLLLAAKAKVNKSQTNGITPLWTASAKGHADVVKLLLAAKADVTKAKTNGATALWIATGKGHVNVVKLLLAAKADVDVSTSANGETYTALGIATALKYTEIIMLLKQHGAKE